MTSPRLTPAIVTLFLFISLHLFGQEENPTQQAQGYLSSQNTSVDHCSGLFHFKVPLYEIKSGQFSLPISLNYTGKSVKYDDRPGFTGLNWSLQAGGMISRTLRGSIPDEYCNDYPGREKYGIAAPPRGQTLPPLKNDLRNINNLTRDGEHDIFTACFNGRSIPFIIVSTSEESWQVETLEKSDVKIRYNNGSPQRWEITDENGIQYYFKSVERFVGIEKYSSVPFNQPPSNYITAWYMDEIIIPGAAPIKFFYRDQHFSDLKANVQYAHQNKTIYYYGKPMIEFPLNFGKYNTDFMYYINEAYLQLKKDEVNDMIKQISTPPFKESLETMMVFDTATMEYRPQLCFVQTFNEKYFENIEKMEHNSNVMGITYNLTSIDGNSYPGVLPLLNDLIKNTSGNTQFYLERAVDCLLDSWNEILKVSKKGVNQVNKYEISPAILDSISNGRETIKFEYEQNPLNEYKGKAGYQLKAIHYHHRNGQTEKTSLSYAKNYLLKSILKISSKEMVKDNFHFEYHFEDDRTSSQKNVWGDFWDGEIITYETVKPVPITKKYALKKITNKYGGEICIDYENNRYFMNMNDIPGVNQIDQWMNEFIYPDTYPNSLERNYGGLRIKSLIMNPWNSKSDTILYHYPLPGSHLFFSISSYKMLRYNYYFEDDNYETRFLFDHKYSSTANKEGYFLQAGGNDGLYYPYVIEEMVGKGKTSYLFSVPAPQLQSNKTAAPYWLYGLPLAQASYDKDGKLVSLSRNTYVTDLSRLEKVVPGSPNYDYQKWFYSGGEKYNRSKLQVRPEEDYLDREKHRKYYNDQGYVEVIKDYLYLNYSELYETNIEPRTSLIIPQQDYTFYYGGKTYLHSQIAWIEGKHPVYGPDITHLTEEIPEGYNLVSDKRFVFHNSYNHPARIEEYVASGEKYVTHYKRVRDYKTALSSRMHSLNLYDPIIKVENHYHKDGRSRLMEESLDLFEEFIPGALVPVKKMQFSTNNPLHHNSDHYIEHPEEYREISGTKYDTIATDIVPITQWDQNDTVQLFYDKELLLPVLNATVGNRESMDFIFSTKKMDDFWSLDRIPEVPCPYTTDFDMRTFIKVADMNFLGFIKYFEMLRAEGLYEKCGYRNEIDLYLEFIISLYDRTYLDKKDYFRENNLTHAMPGFIRNLCMGVPDHDPYFWPSWVADFGYYLSEAAIHKPEVYSYLPVRYILMDSERQILQVNLEGKENKFRVYYLAKGYEKFAPKAEILRDNKTYPLSVEEKPFTSSGWQILYYDIDATGFTGKLYVSGFSTGTEIKMAFIVPHNTSFKGCVWDEGKKPLYEFDQNGNLLRYKYDEADRVVAIYDEEENLVEEKEYYFMNQ